MTKLAKKDFHAFFLSLLNNERKQTSDINIPTCKTYIPYISFQSIIKIHRPTVTGDRWTKDGHNGLDLGKNIQNNLQHRVFPHRSIYKQFTLLFF